ncbi:MAG: plasmid stabilization protein [Desulfobacterales bacterium]|nr:plasmid stabilization protein [Desulfobacterales bacterium]
MASITLRNIDESLKVSLRISAAENGRSMEEEARQILKHFLLRKKSDTGIGTLISNRFSIAGGVELPEMPRHTPRNLPGSNRDDVNDTA